MAFETAEGAQPPLGFFDPLGLLKDADEARFNQLRFVELKHGRISMLGVLGYLVQQNYRFPGFIDLEGDPLFFGFSVNHFFLWPSFATRFL